MGMGQRSATPPEVGAFVYTSWGYDQTNVTFYRVVGHTPTGKSIRVQQAATIRQPMGSQERVTPLDEGAVTTRYDRETGDYLNSTAPVLTVRWNPNGYAKVDRHYAWLWDGTPEYATAPGWGH